MTLEWTDFFHYRKGKRGIFDKIHFIFSYAGFLWFASDEELAWHTEFRAHHDRYSALEKTYSKILTEDFPRTMRTIEEQQVYSSGCQKAWGDIFGKNTKTKGHEKEYWEETERWKCYGYSPEEMEMRRMSPEKSHWHPTREERMLEPIVYEKALREDIHLVVRDKVGGKYTAYLMDGPTMNPKTITLYQIDHIHEFKENLPTTTLRHMMSERDSYSKRMGKPLFRAKCESQTYEVDGTPVPCLQDKNGFSLGIIGYNEARGYIMCNKSMHTRQVLKARRGEKLLLVYVLIVNNSGNQCISTSEYDFLLESTNKFHYHYSDAWYQMRDCGLVKEEYGVPPGKRAILVLSFSVHPNRYASDLSLSYRPTLLTPMLTVPLGERKPWRSFEQNVFPALEQELLIC